MNIINFIILLFSLIWLNKENSKLAFSENQTKSYYVNSINESNSKYNFSQDKFWLDAIIDTSFYIPWSNSHVPYTEFRALYDSQYFYFMFNVVDNDIVVKNKLLEERDVADEDRVEIFFTLDLELGEYYCLEIDPLGRILDYKAKYHRNFDRSWECKEVITKALITDTGYIVRCAIPIKTLNSWGLECNSSGDIIKAGIFRVDFNNPKIEKLKKCWISWVDLKINKPDFHVPSAFGNLVLR